jgi:hypothetical protein
MGQTLAEDEEAGGGAGGAAVKSAPLVSYSSGLSVGKSASKDLFDFMKVFALYAEKDSAGVALREGGFKMADPNGNGLCSLAELEGFVLKSLVKAYPKTG